jgi:oligopeptide transport system permease protein
MSGARETESVAAMMAPMADGSRKSWRDHPLTRSVAGLFGMGFLAVILAACLLTLPWSLGSVATQGDAAGGGGGGVPRYNAGVSSGGRLPPWWVTPAPDQALRLNSLVARERVELIAAEAGVSVEEALARTDGAVGAAMRREWPRFWLGTDVLGRSLLVRAMAGGGISLSIGMLAALLSVFIGTMYGAISGYVGGRVDAAMMRVVDVLYGLPYVLLVVLLAVAGDAVLDEYLSRSKGRAAFVQREALVVMEQRDARPDLMAMEPGARVAAFLSREPALAEELRERALVARPPRVISRGQRMAFDVGVLLVAIGGLSWLTMARVIRGQVLSLKSRPFIEAARAIGVPPVRIFLRHLLPNLAGPIIVYATLTVPQAILQESFLSFLGIGVKPPLPSWGTLAADGLSELNPYRSNWWLLLFPCLLLASTLLALNFVGEGLREALDPRRKR